MNKKLFPDSLMNYSNSQSIRTIHLSLLACAISLSPVYRSRGDGFTDVETVFVIVMENHDWAAIHGNPDCPYINQTLLPIASRAEQYFTPPGLHPSEPNYLWLEAGTNFGVSNDHPPAENHINSTNHLVTLLENAGISWKTYQESLADGDDPLTDHDPYRVKHNPFVFFDDVGQNPARRAAHVRPYSELAADLQDDETTARYIFIIPNITNDMHSLGQGSSSKERQGDDWLAREVPTIMSSKAYRDNGALFITWDEGHGDTSDGPIGLIVLSPLAKGYGYANNIHYTHSSLLRTLQEIFDVEPFLGDAAGANDLRDLFVSDDSPLAAALDVAHGLPQLSLSGLNVGQTTVIEASDNLVDWLPLSTNVATSSTFGVMDQSGTNVRQRFYRALQFP